MKLYLYPFWLRFWHWLNALLFLALIVSGVSLHYSDSQSLLMPFKTAIGVHNGAGVLLAASYLFYIIGNIISGNFKQYIPGMKGLVTRMKLQIGFYISGIFKGEPHPFDVTKERKFNPLQQLTYAAIMYFMMPLLVVSGLLLLFPEYAPDEVLGLGGIWPMATAHAALGFFLSLFMVGHIYLATTGEKVSSNFKSMVTGWHEHQHHDSAHVEHTSTSS